MTENAQIFLAAKGKTICSLAFRPPVKADSFLHDAFDNHEYKPKSVVDDNNATLWPAGDNKLIDRCAANEPPPACLPAANAVQERRHGVRFPRSGQ